MKKRSLIAIVISLAAAVCVAQDSEKDVRAAVEKVKKQTGGQILSTSVDTIDGQRVVRVKVLDKEGVVRYVEIESRP